MIGWLQTSFKSFNCTTFVLFSGGETVEGTADGDARTPRQLHDPRVEPLHSDSCCVRRSVYRSSVGPSWLHGCHRLRYGNTAGCHHHLPVLWDIRQGAERDGRHEYTSLLGCSLRSYEFKKLLFICVGLVIKKTLIVTLTKTLRLNSYWFNVCALYKIKALMKTYLKRKPNVLFSNRLVILWSTYLLFYLFCLKLN